MARNHVKQGKIGDGKIYGQKIRSQVETRKVH